MIHLVSLCEHCRHVREVISGKGSRFLLCQRSLTDPRFPKYPPQPVRRCAGHEEPVDPPAAAAPPPPPT